MKIKEVCARTGLTRRAVRFYIEKGLISPETDPKENNDYRDYSEEDVQKLLLIARLRSLKFPVGKIGELLQDPGQTAAIFAEQQALMREEAQEGEALLAFLGELNLRGADSLDTLYARLEQADSRLHAAPPDAAPDFGRFDDLTREEKRQLRREAALGLEKQGQRRKKKIILLSACALVLILTGLFAAGHIVKEREELTLSSGTAMDLWFTELSAGEFYGSYRTVVDFRTEKNPLTGEQEEFAYRLPLADSERGWALSSSLLLDEKYAGFTLWVKIPRRAAREMGLLDGTGEMLDIQKVMEKLWTDEGFACRYGYIGDVYNGYSLKALP